MALLIALFIFKKKIRLNEGLIVLQQSLCFFVYCAFIFLLFAYVISF
jgi:hypothetical protein